MLISYNELKSLVKRGVINADPKNINGSSIDICLGDEIYVERKESGFRSIDLSDQNDELPMDKLKIGDNGFILGPGLVCLGHSVEIFNLPDDISCNYYMRSSVARRFLNGLTAMWCDPGWSNSQLTLELHNTLKYHGLTLRRGLRVGQMTFLRHEKVPPNISYSIRGRYNNQEGAVQSKGA